MESTLTSKGQVTLPKPIRDHLKLVAQDRVKFFIHPDGSVVILPKLPISALKGILKSRRGTATLEDMEAAVAEGAVNRFRSASQR